MRGRRNVELETVVILAVGTSVLGGIWAYERAVEPDPEDLRACSVPPGATVLWMGEPIIDPKEYTYPFQEAIIATGGERRSGRIKNMDCGLNGEEWRESGLPISRMEAEFLAQALGRGKEELCPDGDLEILEAETRTVGTSPMRRAEVGAYAWFCQRP